MYLATVKCVGGTLRSLTKYPSINIVCFFDNFLNKDIFLLVFRYLIPLMSFPGSNWHNTKTSFKTDKIKNSRNIYFDVFKLISEIVPGILIFIRSINENSYLDLT